MTDEYESAATEARDRGMAFLVDGRHVSADRVMILSLPDTTGPISSMRQAKVEAQAMLAGMESSKQMNKLHVVTTGQHLRQIMDVLGLKKEPHWDDTWLGMHSYITMVDIEAKCRALVDDLADAHADTERIDWLDKHGQLSTSKGHMRWVIVTDSGITNVRLAMDSKGALKPFDADRRDKWKTTCSAKFEGTCEERDKLFELADAHAARPTGVIVNDIVVTDPALLEPITEPASGVTQACGVCGAPFVAVDSLFCEAHRG